MNKTKNILIIFTLALTVFFFESSQVSALTLYTETLSPIHVGDNAIIKIFADTEGKEINAIEGELEISGDFEIAGLSTAGSIFELWPNLPKLNGNKIYFVGGTASGVYGKELRVFNIILKPKSTESLSIKTINGKAFLNDGQATIVSVTPNTNKISVSQNNKAPIDFMADSINNDKTPPSQFSIELGNGLPGQEDKYFLSFSTVDADTGIERYEVQEGNKETVVANGTYILQDQSLKSPVTVTAYDKAGNKRSEKIPLDSNSSKKALWTIIAILAITKSILLYKKLKKTK